MARLFELTSEGKLLHGINNRLYYFDLGKSFINDEAPRIEFSREFSHGRILEADYEDRKFFPAEFEEARVIILIQDQFQSIGSWDLYHPLDPFCEEPHTPGVACHKCQHKGKNTDNYRNCGHICTYCGGRLRVRPRRIHNIPLPVLEEGYGKRYIRKGDVRSGKEALIYMNPGDELLIVRYARAWWRYYNRRLFYDVEGNIRLTHFSDRADYDDQAVWL